MQSSSEVARIRQQIADEYRAASRVFCDFAEVSKHEYITARQENLSRCFENLTHHMTPDEAMKVFIQACERTIDYRPGSLPFEKSTHLE